MRPCPLTDPFVLLASVDVMKPSSALMLCSCSALLHSASIVSTCGGGRTVCTQRLEARRKGGKRSRHRSIRDAEQGLLGIRRDEGTVLAEKIAAPEAPATGEYRAVLAQQHPLVACERPVEPHGVTGHRRGELGAVAGLAQPVHRPYRRADQREVRCVRGERGREVCVDRWRAHPYLELGGAGGWRIEVDDRPRLPGNQVEAYLVFGAQRRADRVDGLQPGAVLGDVHRDRRGADRALALCGGDRQRRERPALVMDGCVVLDGFVGATLPRKKGVK